MPQPYNGQFRTLTGLNDYPKMAAHIGIIASLWTHVEFQLGCLLATMLKAEAGLAITMYMVIRADAAKLAAIDAIANQTLLDSKLKEEYAEIKDKVAKTSVQRNKVVHGLWATVENDPDILVMVSPRLLLPVAASLIGPCTEWFKNSPDSFRFP